MHFNCDKGDDSHTSEKCKRWVQCCIVWGEEDQEQFGVNITRRNADENRIYIIQSRTQNGTGDNLWSFRTEIRTDVAKSTDMKVGIKKIASVLDGLRTIPFFRKQLCREETHCWRLESLLERDVGERKRKSSESKANFCWFQWYFRID